MMSTMTLLLPPARPRKRRKVKSSEDAATRFMEFLHATREWAEANRDRLAKIYIIVKKNHFYQYIISKSTAHDFELTKSHTDFSIAIWDAKRISIIGSQIPDGDFDELSAYFDSNRAFVMIPQ